MPWERNEVRELPWKVNEKRENALGGEVGRGELLLKYFEMF